jgi:hypothetical protein
MRKKKPSCMKILGTQEMIIGLRQVVLHHKFWRVKPLRTLMTRMETMRPMMTRIDYEECEEVSPTTAKGKRHVSVGRKDKGKKPRSLGGHWVQDQLSKLVTASEKSTTSVESLARKEDNGCSIRDVMALVKECGAVPGTKEHFITSQVFVKRAEREMFMTLDTPEERFNWLTKKHDWVTRMSH